MNIYLDYNATTPVDDVVLSAMLPYFNRFFGNASSKNHSFGWIAEQAVETAKMQIARLINAQSDEIILTSGATESINLALKGFAEKTGSEKNHIISSVTEHMAVLDTLSVLEKKGFEITLLPVNAKGQINVDELRKSIKPSTMLICLMYANNETGYINPVNEIAEIAHENKCLFFCDATQAAGKIPIDVKLSNIDMLCLSAHKMYGPKGVGALYIRNKRPKISLTPLIDGGGQQNGLRSGTLNVAGIVGMGKACELAAAEMSHYTEKMINLRNRLENEISTLPGIKINGDTNSRLPNTSNICFKGKTAGEIFKSLKNIAVSSGSACTSAKTEASHVLLSMGLNNADAQSSIRFSLGKFNTLDDIENTVTKIKKLYE